MPQSATYAGKFFPALGCLCLFGKVIGYIPFVWRERQGLAYKQGVVF